MSSDVSSMSDMSTVSSLSSRISGSRKGSVPVSRGKAGPRVAALSGVRGAAAGVGARRPTPAPSTARKGKIMLDELH